MLTAKFPRHLGRTKNRQLSGDWHLSENLADTSLQPDSRKWDDTPRTSLRRGVLGSTAISVTREILVDRDTRILVWTALVRTNRNWNWQNGRNFRKNDIPRKIRNSLMFKKSHSPLPKFAGGDSLPKFTRTGAWLKPTYSSKPC